MHRARRGRAAWALVLLAGVLVGGAARARDMEAALGRMSAALNSGLPFMVDKITRLDRTQGGPGAHFTFHYTLPTLTAADVVLPRFNTVMRRTVVRRGCNEPPMRRLLGQGVTLHYIYRGNDGAEVARFAVVQTDCGSI